MAILLCPSSRAVEQKKFIVVYNDATEALIPLVKAVYNRIGLEPDFILVPSERAIYGTNIGSYDADLSRVEGSLDKYPNLIFTKEPIKVTKLYAFARKEARFSVKNIDDIKNHSVGIIRGSKLPEMFIAKKAIKAEVANSFSNLHSMFKLGRFEIALITDTQLLSHSEQMSKIAVQIGPALQTSSSFHVLNKRHENLIPKFDSALRKIKSE